MANEFDMIPPGSPMDFVERRPADESRKQQESIEEMTQEDLLKKQASFLIVSQSEAGKKIAEIIEKELIERINFLLENDEQSKAYLKILGNLQAHTGIAHRAAAILMGKTMKNGVGI